MAPGDIILSVMLILTLSTCYITGLTLEEQLEQLRNNYVSKRIYDNKKKTPKKPTQNYHLFLYSDRHPPQLMLKGRKSKSSSR